MKGGGRELSSRVRVRQGAPKDPTARDTAHWDRPMRQVRKRKSISLNLVVQRGEHAHHIRTCHRTTLHSHRVHESHRRPALAKSINSRNVFPPNPQSVPGRETRRAAATLWRDQWRRWRLAPRRDGGR